MKQINWLVLNNDLKNMREDQVKELLDTELVGEGRWTLIERLHQRYTNMRRDREREELRAKYKKSTEPSLLA